MIRDIFNTFSIGLALIFAGCGNMVVDTPDTPVAEGGTVIVKGDVMGGGSTRADGGDICDGVFPDPSLRDCDIAVKCIGRVDGKALTEAERKDVVFTHKGNGLFVPKNSQEQQMFFPTDAEYIYEAYYPATVLTTLPFFNANEDLSFTGRGFPKGMITTGALMFLSRTLSGSLTEDMFALFDIDGAVVASTWNILSAQSESYRNKYTDILHARGAVASSENPVIQFNGENKFRHIMSKIHVVFDASGDDDANTLYYLDFPDLKHVWLPPENAEGFDLNNYVPHENTFSRYTVNNNLISSLGEEYSEYIRRDPMSASPFDETKEIVSKGVNLTENNKFVNNKVFEFDILVVPQTVEMYARYNCLSAASEGDDVTDTKLFDKTYTVTLEAGKVYTVTIASKSGTLVFRNVFIEDWNEGGTSSIVSDPQ